MTDRAGLDCEVPEHAVDLPFAGTILPGAMPYLNRYRGNPVLTSEIVIAAARAVLRVTEVPSVANGNSASPREPEGFRELAQQ